MTKYSYFCSNNQFHHMKKTILIATAILLSCLGCQRNNGTLTGTWKVEKVAVDFDERLSTPEIVKQTGIIEKENLLIIAADSTMTFISQGDTIKGKFSVEGAQIQLNGKTFGTITENGITTAEASPFGKITVDYQKIR